MNKPAEHTAGLGCVLYVVLFIALTVVAQGAMNHWYFAVAFFVVGFAVYYQVYWWAKRRS